jgi:hypothetical protein
MKPTKQITIPSVTLDSVLITKLIFQQPSPDKPANVSIVVTPYSSEATGSVNEKLSKTIRLGDVSNFPEMNLALQALEVATQTYINSSSLF